MSEKLELTNPRVVRELLDRYSLAPKKGYGQNFLINRDVPCRIAGAAAAGCDVGYDEAPAADGVAVLEIGPGIGTMTCELSELFEKVVAVEIDSSLIPLLGETLRGRNNVKIINSDFMKCDVPSLIASEVGDMPLRVCANLPYYVTTPVLMKLLEAYPPVGKPRIETATVMIQSEVADRLCATERDAEYGAITASVALHGTAKKLFTVPAGCFYPAPKVTSCVVQITMHDHGVRDVYDKTPDDDVECAKFVLRAKRLIELAFLQRRKTLTNALSGEFPKEEVAAALESLGIRPDVRGERLSARDFCALADVLYK